MDDACGPLHGYAAAVQTGAAVTAVVMTGLVFIGLVTRPPGHTPAWSVGSASGSLQPMPSARRWYTVAVCKRSHG